MLMVTNRRATCGAALMLAPLFVVLGCAEPLPEGLPELHPVTLEFTQAGAPLAGASVQLVPVDTSNTWVSGGGTDSSGKVSVQTHGKYDGAPAGKYKVCVTKMETEGEAGGLDPANPNAAASTQKVFTLVDPQYTVQNTTPLEIEITGSGDSFEPFDLGEAVRAEVAAPPME